MPRPPADLKLDEDILAAMIEWRRDVHAHPELAFDETRTADLLTRRLGDAGLEVMTGFGTTGIVAKLQGNMPGPGFAFRSDMDALPMDEENRFAHRSVHAGRMHACGHDGHAAMLLGAALHLSKERDFAGTLYFLFQPAEEVGAGAAAMIADGALEAMADVEMVFGMHNSPGLGIGEMSIWSGPVLAGSSLFDIRISGVGCHAALPHQGSDCIGGAAQLVTALNAITARNIDPMANAVVSVTRLQGGTTYNVVPDCVTISGGMRFLTADVGARIEDRIRQLAANIASAFGATAEVDIRPQIPPLINDERATQIATGAARAWLGPEAVRVEPGPVMGSDDFSCFAAAWPGCYALIGNGPADGGCMVHSPLYDFNDEAQAFGIGYWIALATRLTRREA